MVDHKLIGKRVRLEGLVAQAQYNGMMGIVKKFLQVLPHLPALFCCCTCCVGCILRDIPLAFFGSGLFGHKYRESVVM